LAVILKNNNINVDFAKQFDADARLNEVPMIEIFDENKKELVSFSKPDLPSFFAPRDRRFCKSL